MVAVDRGEEAVFSDGFALEEKAHVVGEGRPVVFEGEQVIGALGADRLGDFPLASHGVDGDKRAFEFEPFEQPGIATISLLFLSTAS